MAMDRSHPSILAVGRLVEAKDWPTLLHAWSQVGASIDLAGNGELMPELQRMAQQLELEDRVRFLGHRDDVPYLLQNADMVVSASKREGFSYVILEALQAECIVVSTPTGVAPQLIPSDYLFPVGNAHECADCVNRALGKLATAKAAFEPAWRKANELTVARMAKETEALYRRILSRRDKR